MGCSTTGSSTSIPYAHTAPASHSQHPRRPPRSVPRPQTCHPCIATGYLPRKLTTPRLIDSARVIDGEICYSEKNTTTVYGLFQERFKLHKTIYQHQTGAFSPNIHSIRPY